MLLKASCHCQAVKFEVESHTPYPFLRCFCSICRKTAGGGFAINIMGEAKTLKIKGKRYYLDNKVGISQDRQAIEISENLQKLEVKNESSSTV